MSETLRRVQTLVLAGDYLISDHGFNELAKDGILPTDVLTGIVAAIVIEDYQIEHAAQAFWSCKGMRTVCPFMSSGEFPQTDVIPRCS